MIGRLTCACCCPDLPTSSPPPPLLPPSAPPPAPPPPFLSVYFFLQSLIATTYGKPPGAILVGVLPLIGFPDVCVLLCCRSGLSLLLPPPPPSFPPPSSQRFVCLEFDSYHVRQSHQEPLPASFDVCVIIYNVVQAYRFFFFFFPPPLPPVSSWTFSLFLTAQFSSR